jgi:hypothetical protein
MYCLLLVAKCKRMKKVIISALFATFIVGGLCSCSKVLSKIFGGVDVNLPDIVVPGPAPPEFLRGQPGIPGENPLPSYTQSFNLDSIVKANTAGAFGAEDVNSVKVKKIVFTVLNPDADNNLRNFKSARFELASNTNTTPVSIASFQFPDAYSETLTYDASDDAPELKGYLTGTSLSYYSYGEVRRFPTRDMTLTVKVTIAAK